MPTLEELKNTNYLIKNKSIAPLSHEYSNLNYSLLGLIIEKVSKLTFKTYMIKELFSPLDMKNSLIGRRDEVAPNLINHYQYLGPFPIRSKQLNFSQSSIPAGFICSSAQDLGNYLKLNLANGIFNQANLIDSVLLQSMHTVWDEKDYGYAMGWKQGWGRWFIRSIEFYRDEGVNVASRLESIADPGGSLDLDNLNITTKINTKTYLK